jgi:hypothetical protein
MDRISITAPKEKEFSAKDVRFSRNYAPSAHIIAKHMYFYHSPQEIDTSIS